MKLLVAGIVVLALSGALAGCSATATPEPAASSSASSTTAPLPTDTSLLPATIDPVTGESAEAEGSRVADALQALIDGIVYVDDNSQLVPVDGDTPAYYAVYRTITLETAVDPLVMGAQLTTVLQESGWSVYETTNEDGQYLSALSSGDSGWFALVGGDATVEGQPVVTFQIASPDIQ